MNEVEVIRVLCADDHELLRRGIQFALLSFDDLELVGEAASGEEALILCAEMRPDVVLMDMRMAGGMDGIAAVRTIREDFPQVQVIALSSFFDRELVQGAMQAGAIGYLVKGVSGDELAEAIRGANAGRPALATEALDVLVQPSELKTRPVDELTHRENEVLVFLVEGLSNAEIASQMHVSVSAVKYHVSNILSKLGAANRTEAAALARRQGLGPGAG